MTVPSASVLVVDDEPSILTLLQGILKPHYTVYMAASGEVALKIANKNKPDIILLDVVMKDMSGFEVLTQLKQSDATRNTPVILLTGLNDSQNEEAGLNLGAVDYIRKPFSAAVVLLRIQTQLETAFRLREKDGATLVLRTRQTERSVTFRELMYVDVSGHWLNFHLSSGETVPIYSTLKEYESVLLNDPRFERCHKSFIVNMDYISSVEIRDEARDITLKNNEVLPVSRSYLKFKKRYAEWIGG